MRIHKHIFESLPVLTSPTTIILVIVKLSKFVFVKGWVLSISAAVSESDTCLLSS